MATHEYTGKIQVPARHRCGFAPWCRLHMAECDNRSFACGKVKRKLYFSGTHGPFCSRHFTPSHRENFQFYGLDLVADQSCVAGSPGWTT